MAVSRVLPQQRRLSLCAALVALSVTGSVACSSPDDSDGDASGGMGAFGATGGAPGATGGRASGGTGAAVGGTVTGGTSSVGGVPAATGGTSVQTGGTATNTGGTATNTGGATTNTGGTSGQTGGVPSSTGGLTAQTGGATSTGGAAPATGGAGTDDCTDTPTDDGVTCAQWLEWGECDSDWMVMNDLCNATCSRCEAGTGGASSTGGATSTGGETATGGATATGGTTGSGTVFSQCRFHFGSIDSMASDSTVPELDFFTPGWMVSESFDQQYVCDEGNPGGRYENQVPMIVGYLAAAIVKNRHSLCDCNVGGCSGGDLCQYGAQYIVQDWDTILNAYRNHSQSYASCYGTSRPIIFKMEPDWYQYTYDSQSQPWSASDAGQRMSELVAALSASLPNAYFALDVSPWVGSNGADNGAAWYANFDLGLFTFMATSGGGTNADTDRLRDANEMTWSGLNQVTGRPILADTGYGANGVSEGHDPNWDIPANLNDRIADGVVAITQYNPSSNWGSTIASIRGQLDTPRYCP